MRYKFIQSSSFALACLLLQSCSSSSDTPLQTQQPTSESWRFITLADWHSAEKFIMGERHTTHNDAVNENINTLKWMQQNVGGDLIVLPGDSNGGHWDTPKFIKKFNPKLSAKESILQAGELCYEGMTDTFEKGGYSTLLMAVGDHEVGDNPWPVGSDVSKYQAEFRHSFAKSFNYQDDGTTFKFPAQIGSVDARPLGTKYQDTSFAYQHKNALFITLDVFHQEDYKTKLGEQGTVTGTVVGPHLQWFTNVLKEAQNIKSIKHIFVQSHLPVIYPVRKVSSSGMLMDDGVNSAFWQAMRKYGVDIYFAGEVHANTVTKDPGSDLVQVVSRGNFFTNFQTIDVGEDTIEMTLYRHFGEHTSDGKFEETGKLSIDKSAPQTTIEGSGGLAVLKPESKLLHFDFEQEFSLVERPINGLSEKKRSYYLDDKKSSHSFANTGTFGSQYDALHYSVNQVPAEQGYAGEFNGDSQMSVFAMGPLQGDRPVAYEISFKTDSNNNQILINTAGIWSNSPQRFLNLYLDKGKVVVATSDKQFLKAQHAPLNDGKWHTVKVAMSKQSPLFSKVTVEVDGNLLNTTLQGEDTKLNLNQAMRFAIGSKGYSAKVINQLPVSNFIGQIDNVSLWTL